GTIFDFNDFEDIEYITLLDSTVTDESKFDKIYKSEIMDNGIIFTLESDNMIDRINEKGIGIIITDPIENVYDALMLLSEKQQIINNENNLFDVIGKTDDSDLLFDDPCTLVRFFGIDDTSSEHIIELTDNLVKILIPDDILFTGYNHLFFGHYDALYREIGLTDTNFMNLGIDIDNDSTYKFKNSAIKEISFNYIIPKVLEIDTLVLIDDYIGEFINIVLSDSTSAVIFIKDILGNQVYTTSLSYQSIENGFHWNGLLNPGQSDNGEYRYEVIPFSVNGVLGESKQGTIIIDRRPDIEIILPEDNVWYNNNLLLVAENHTYPIGAINWYMNMGFGNIGLGTSFNNDTISFNTNTTINGDSFRIFAESSDR
ncbi:hypothetical protein KAU15_01215, partial [candidate division WOR-3 bacterium]|nr:hypothetical protein [candidate division WOR-3 bacterium]